MKITILYDNHGCPGFESGWGFSCLVDSGQRILFDTGDDGNKLIHNFEKANVDPKSVNKLKSYIQTIFQNRQKYPLASIQLARSGSCPENSPWSPEQKKEILLSLAVPIPALRKFFESPESLVEFTACSAAFTVSQSSPNSKAFN
jgi:hypothetical protein